MSRKIMIIDTVATNRIVLRVKMKAAQYDVSAYASCIEAGERIVSDPPDLVLINLADPTEDRHGFCRRLRDDALTAHIGIISLGMDDTAKARFAALDSGADDVLPRPISDTLLLARVRNLLRRRNLYHEWDLSDGSLPSLGFEEAGAERLAPASVLLLSSNAGTAVALTGRLQAGLGHAIRQLPAGQTFVDTTSRNAPDLYVIDGSAAQEDPQPLMQLISDLRGGSDQRHAGRLVIVPPNRPDLAALFLDLGADDVAPVTATAEELAIRARNLLAQKARKDRMRAKVRDGLEASVTDCLTGLRNRRYAETHLARIAEQAHQAGCDYALMMLDIDHFKDVNDRYGHAAGDAVLRQLADRLKRCFRSIDLVARMGGEEFLIAMPGTSTEQALIAAERVRKLVRERPFRLSPDGPELQITVSVGVAVDHLDAPAHPTEAEMCDRADAALYLAKSGGRNRVQMHLEAA